MKTTRICVYLSELQDQTVEQAFQSLLLKIKQSSDDFSEGLPVTNKITDYDEYSFTVELSRPFTEQEQEWCDREEKKLTENQKRRDMETFIRLKEKYGW